MDPAVSQLPNYTAFSHDDLDAELCQLSAHLYAGEYRLLMAIREWDSRSLCGQYGVRSTAHWLNYKCGIALGAAREKVRVARALDALPMVSQLFSQGRISYSKVRALTRVATPGNERYLVHVALNGTASHMERLAAGYRRMERLHDPERVLRQRRERGFDWSWDDDGMLVLRGRLSPEDGALLIRAIETMRERMYREERAEQSEDSMERGHGKVEDDVASKTQARRADALLRLVESGVQGEARPLAGGERVQVVLHVPVETSAAAVAQAYREEVSAGSLARSDVSAETCEVAAAQACPKETSDELGEDRGANEDPDAYAQAPGYASAAPTFVPLSFLNQPRLEPGTSVSWQTARRLACDASLVLMRVSGKGEPLSIGRRARSVPWRIRMALEQRDGGCRFPGCTVAAAHTDAHHIRHWADGGETSLDNLTLTCRTHHRLLHEEGFDCQRLDDGEIVFLYPDGSRVPEAHPLKGGSYLDLVDLNHRAKLSISSRTCNGGWDGERFSMSEVIAQLQCQTYGWDWDPPPRPPRRRLPEELLQRIEALTGERPQP